MPLLIENDITAVVNVTCQVENAYPEFIDYFRIPVEDIDRDAPILKLWLESAIDFINGHILQGHNVLIHCEMGRSRSVVVTIAYLMTYQNMSFEDSLNTIEKVRGKTRMLRSFIEKCFDK